MPAKSLKAERPIECRTPWFHAEFFMHAGVIRFRNLKPSIMGTHLVPGSIKFTIDLDRLKAYDQFWSLLMLIMERHKKR